jgi:hypothetical protein
LGGEQKEALEKINAYLAKPLVLRVPKIGGAFRLYVAATDKVIGAMIAQEDAGKEFAVAYMSRRMMDANTRYTHVERLCLVLYYASYKFKHYLLSNTCTVACKHNVVKHLIQKPILSGMMGKWAFSLVEYDLVYEPLRAARGQAIADFITDHSTELGEMCMVEACSW